MITSGRAVRAGSLAVSCLICCRVSGVTLRSIHRYFQLEDYIFLLNIVGGLISDGCMGQSVCHVKFLSFLVQTES